MMLSAKNKLLIFVDQSENQERKARRRIPRKSRNRRPKNGGTFVRGKDAIEWTGNRIETIDNNVQDICSNF
jgi:hypothetical protein